MAADEPVLDVSALAALEEVVGAAASAEIARLFREDSENRVARGGAALAVGDLAAVAREFHALKSSAATLGAWRLSALAARLEAAGLAGDVMAARQVGVALDATLRATLDALAGGRAAA
ncbi:Hpt domain-containing protein [Roseococcus suduntuyensis]|uniref:HPt (Histidine-containing phosphotransfer) domain-containing protein n=1 Tax=Roseococcus suduntuyensis TaxID=455361 RepID=A0A840A5P2_9PROT|nr:Hpt domain-containing protein [Roseococcus suduntuyensis]MBB3897278.1 HPt (histidine-containing phosphotransfer) domain-containing protein [Roseococcus suduntuyensis]